MVMTSDETQIQIFADWPMSHAKQVTKDKGKNLEYHVVVPIRKLRTDKIVPQKNHGQTKLKLNNSLSGGKCENMDIVRRGNVVPFGTKLFAERSLMQVRSQHY